MRLLACFELLMAIQAAGGISLLQEITETISAQNGIVFSSPALVHRVMYTGRGIIAPNRQFTKDLVDHRGFLPVEWWIMSRTEAKNSIPVQNEGITHIIINGRPVLLTSALEVAEIELMGSFEALWPLTKVLDIGGVERSLNFVNGQKSTVSEVPPIPCHVHAGDVQDGHCVGHGKTEAYFFPPLDIPPYNKDLGPVKTRLGLKPDVTKEEVLSCLKQFGKGDDLYALLNEYPIRPWETWTIEEKVIHAPGPWLTLEMQLPQDDFHLLAWVLGTKLPSHELKESRETYQFRGLKSFENILEETLNWDMNTDPNFKDHWWRRCEELHKGKWGRVVRLFYHIFYGEGYVVHPGCKYSREPGERPFAGIVWSGKGNVNGLSVDCKDQQRKEFLVTPNHLVEFENTSETQDLMVFTVFPLVKPTGT